MVLCVVIEVDPLQKERFAIQSEIRQTSTANLQPPLDESSLLQELVAQFLAHDGYVETARAFSEEVAAESAALQNGREEPLKMYEVEEDVEAVNRQSTLPVLWGSAVTDPTMQRSARPFWTVISTKH